tara:strand:- start:271 stop:411 length:141 start_codon:yes stop_codon:yes gene_type:complete
MNMRQYQNNVSYSGLFHQAQQTLFGMSVHQKNTVNTFFYKIAGTGF